MFRPMGRLLVPLALAGGLLLLAPLFNKVTNIGGLGGVAWAQAENFFNSEYFDDSVGGGTVSILNPESAPTECALIYVFRSDEQLEECCGCPVTNSGGLRTIRVATQLSETGFTNHDPAVPTQAAPELFGYNTLTDNPANGRFIPRGVIKILSSLPNAVGSVGPGVTGGCDPSLPPVAPLEDALREYGTAVQVSKFVSTPLSGEDNGGVINAAFAGVSEHLFQGAPDPTLSGEVADLTNFCTAIFQLGSRFGICGCGIGDVDPHPAHF
jgi:hypothetical protein